jgi:capsular polysaccharide export protein
VCSPFFFRLAKCLEGDGHAVFKVNFNVGDALYWGRSGLAFRRPVEELKDFLDSVYRRYGITDQLLFGDRRPIHRPALAHAEVCGIRTHVFEEGYFRPYWVTLEREGVNGHSLLPRDPDWFWSVGERLEGDLPFESFHSPFLYRAAHDVAYHLSGTFNPVAFPHYRTHAPVNAAMEYAAYIGRFTRVKRRKAMDDATVNRLVAGALPYFVLPLQLNSDAQIRDHSRFGDMLEVIDYVLASFAGGAPGNSRLVIKNHPLDMGMVDYPVEIRNLAERYGLVTRVDYLETGDLGRLLERAVGIVTVNSTVGSFALGMGCPTIALSDPIYNLPGLTYQGNLNDFWRDMTPPNPEMFRRFRNVVMFATQVNGGFYCRTGIDLAVKNSAAALESDVSSLESLM